MLKTTAIGIGFLAAESLVSLLVGQTGHRECYVADFAANNVSIISYVILGK